MGKNNFSEVFKHTRQKLKTDIFPNNKLTSTYMVLPGKFNSTTPRRMRKIGFEFK